jgi:hypothetical protein
MWPGLMFAGAGKEMRKSWFVLRWMLLLSTVLVLVAPAVAQEGQQPTGVPVSMVVTVEPRHGENAPPVDQADVMVYEGNQRDNVSQWLPAQGEHAALELFILLDDSSSASLGSQLDDVRQFIRSQPPTTKIGVAYMQNGTAQIVQNLTDDHEQAAKSLRLPSGVAGINASPYFALSDLIKRWPGTSSRREVFLVSDGIDRYYGAGDLQDPYVNDAIEQAQRAGIVVFTLYNPGVGHYGHSYWRTYWGQIYLSQVADRTGGESYYIGFNGPAVSFVPYLDDVTHRLRNQYLLTFLAKPEKKSGMQRVRLTTELPHTDLVAADRVYVPASP